MLRRMRKWTAIGVCVVVALSGAVAFALTRGSDAAPVPQPRKAVARFAFPEHIAALPPEVRPRLFPAAVEAKKPKAEDKRDHTAKRETKERATVKEHAQPAAEDPGLGGPSGGYPAPGGGSKPVVAPTPVPTIVPSTAQTPVPSVSVPAGTTVGTVIDLITEKTGAPPATTLPPSTPVVPNTTTVDCTASNSGSNSSGSTPGGSGKSGDDHGGSSKDQLVNAVVQALCGDAAASVGADDHSGPGSGKSGSDGVSGSSHTR